MSHDYLPRPKPPQDNEVDDVTAAAEKRDMANRFGGTYLQPGKIYRNHDDSAVESIKRRLDDAESEDHRKTHEALSRGAIHVDAMSRSEQIYGFGKQHPTAVVGIVGSLVTIVFGVRAAYKGQMNRSYRLMNVRLGFGVLVLSSLLFSKIMQNFVYQQRLLEIKKELLEELGESENSTT